MAKPNNTRRNINHQCVHHWLCGGQEHRTVHAVCAKCGMETDFTQCEIPEKFDLKRKRSHSDLFAAVDSYV